MYPDYHMHTNFSDGRDTHEDMLASAQMKGISEIGFTDHISVKPIGWSMDLFSIPLMIETVGQLIALARGNYQWTAKPSEIYINKQNHDSIFTKDIPNYGKDIVFCSNLFKAAKRGLTKYLELQVHNNEVTWNIFNKPIVKAYVYRTALLYYYQKYNHDRKYSDWLYKIASPTLVADFEKIYSKSF